MTRRGPGGAPGGGVPAPGVACATPPEDARVRAGARTHAAGDPAPVFSPAFYATAITLNVSADEMTGDQLPTGKWGTDEDGAPVPTFAVSRADITA